MSNTALITGASSGIGTELARTHAATGGDLVLVARSADKLQDLKIELEQAHGVSIVVITEDLSGAGSAQSVFAATEKAGLQIDVLMNNAGFGGHGKFHERDLRREEQMMQLNMATLTSLTHLYLQGMVERNRGMVLNVASTAGFMPGPLQAVYYASKAYVVSFSQAIAEELSDTDISVTALCPGPVATGFVASGDLQGVEIFDKAASARDVAEFGYKAMKSKKLIAINELGLSVMLKWVTPLLPRKMLLKISRKAMEKTA
ncbi:MAG: SDR family NAD(P)-dependent oxidoreductase [Oceanococcus sp.]